MDRQAYSCEYQNLVINAARECGTTLNINFPPYFPPPANAPGACSCPLGEVYFNMRISPIEATRCQNYVGELSNQGQLTGAQHVQDLYDCSCCAASHAVSV